MPRITAPTVAEHHQQRRRAIVAAAAAAYATGGAAAVTPAAVAQEAGLARSSIYQYFASSGALVGAGVEELFRLALAEITAAMAGAATPVDRVAAYVAASVRAAAAGHLPARLPAEALPPECAERVTTLHRALTEPLLEALADAGVPEPPASGRLVTGVISAAAEQVVGGTDADTVSHRAQQFVLAGLGLDPGTGSGAAA